MRGAVWCGVTIVHCADRPTALVLSRSTYSNKSDNNLDSPLNSALRSGQMRSSMETSTAGPGPGSQGSALGVTNSSKPGVTSGTGQRGMNSTLSAKQVGTGHSGEFSTCPWCLARWWE